MADLVGDGRNGGPIVSTFQMTQNRGGILGPLAGFPVNYPNYAWPFGIRGLIMLLGAVAWTAGADTLPVESEDANAERSVRRRGAGIQP